MEQLQIIERLIQEGDVEALNTLNRYVNKINRLRYALRGG